MESISKYIAAQLAVRYIYNQHVETSAVEQLKEGIVTLSLKFW